MLIADALAESIRCKTQFVAEHHETLQSVARLCVMSLRSGGKILVCGNGGSASDAQHFAAELVGRYQKERGGLACIALTTDSSILTAVSNDYSYSQVFSRQVDALGRSGDILIALSTSGNSANVLDAVDVAMRREITTVGLTGDSGGKLADLVDIPLIVRGSNLSSRIQETHIFALHCLAELIEESF
jgi:D-sedoheptulose 7-phosphate isomerase